MSSGTQPPYYFEIRKGSGLPLMPLRIAWKFGNLETHLEVVATGDFAVQIEALAMDASVYAVGSRRWCHEGCFHLGGLCRGFLGKACVGRVLLG